MRVLNIDLKPVNTEHPMTCLWHLEVFKHDVPEWPVTDYASLEDVRQTAQNDYDRV